MTLRIWCAVAYNAAEPLVRIGRPSTAPSAGNDFHLTIQTPYDHLLTVTMMIKMPCKQQPRLAMGDALFL